MLKVNVEYKIAIIGVGNMGAAIYKALIKNFDAENIFVSDTSEEKLKALNTKNIEVDANDILGKVDIVILAVKPQSFEEFSQNLRVDLKNKLLISIMAGISIKKISEFLKTEKVVRSMPNLCAQVEKGLIGWLASDKVSDNEKELAKKIFGSFGEQIELKNEDEINKITALSGSGPAYFFYLTELLEEKAKAFGFNDEEAKLIANTTFVGAAKTLEKQKSSAKNLKNAVTSKGGTTEAALNFMKENNFDKIFFEALDKAKKRAEELNN
jgi:pyrroline-5-carboxylate reductase